VDRECQNVGFAPACIVQQICVHLLEKSVINTIRLLLTVFDWPNIMIRPGDLLLVVATYFAFQFYEHGFSKK
jgi:hypothetical protein